MPGEKRFGNTLFGFKKSDVNYYVEKMLKEFDDKLKEKDNEISAIRIQNRDLKTKYEELLNNSEHINEERVKIAEVMIKAQEKANLILDEAQDKAIDEKRKLEKMVEEEREKLVDAKEELKLLKQEAINTLKKFENQINLVVDSRSEIAVTDEVSDEAK